MGRPPCCDKVGIKKGPWTPEEDIILVTYIQEHGPGNWRLVPTNTGLLRCSKSCRLRWTNYLRPGIKRGNFTPHEEGMIIHLQALLGNKWAAIASYLPQRTDNDIKNYWNTHLKKKLKKFQSSFDTHHIANDHSTTTTTSHDQLGFKSFSERINKSDVVHNASSLTVSQSSTYASSTENISRLLEGWMRSSPKGTEEKVPPTTNSNNAVADENAVNSARMLDVDVDSYPAKTEQEGFDMVSREELGSILSFDQNLNNASWDKSTCDSVPVKAGSEVAGEDIDTDQKELQAVLEKNKERSEDSSSTNPPLSFIEKWLLDECVGHVEDIMELSPMF